MKKLTAEQKKLVDDFAAMHQEYAHIIDKYNKMKKQVGELVSDDKSQMPLELVGKRFTIDYSEPAKVSECLFSPREFIHMTQEWGALKVSVSDAKELLSPEQFDNMFSVSPGSRRFKRVRLTETAVGVKPMPASTKKTPKAPVAESGVEVPAGRKTRRIASQG